MADRYDASSPRRPHTPKRWVPPPALTAFLVLLVVMFAASYGIGSASGPVAPGMHSTGIWNTADQDTHRDEQGDTHGESGH